jgi:PEP-CTERM motif
MLTRHKLIAAALVLLPATVLAQDWEGMPFTSHASYQSVNADGSSAYAEGFPIRTIGVVLNHTEDWLDPAPAHTPGYVPFAMGGEAELYVQAVNLDATEWDSDPDSAFDDFGGTSAWIGQNYGNLPFKGDPVFSYTDAQWTSELGRLNLFGGDGVTDPIRSGDLVEIRARGGLHYQGKMNVNEQHSNDPQKDFEIIRLVEGFGLPAPEPVALADLKDANDAFLFDPTRQSGGERYQSTLVELRDVWVNSPTDWLTDSDLAVTDGVRMLKVHLGLNSSFDGTELYGLGERFNVVGILDQAASDGTYSTDGYQLLAMNANDFTPVPEPGSLVAIALAVATFLRRRR